MRYCALVEYDGAAYFGFQRQRADQPTIQGELEKAVSHLAQTPTAVIGAGRTDRGVHALGQVVAFDLAWRHGAKALLRAINATLPDDIVIRQLREAADDFHPRFDARRRSYEYHIYNAVIRSPIKRLRSWHVRQPLDVTSMNQAAKQIVGVHDFVTFGQPPQGDNTVREVFVAEWQRHDDCLIFRIQANAFLQRMVRSLVGSLKAVGEGSWSVADFAAAFQACDRGQSATVAPPHGLYLVAITYDELGLETADSVRSPVSNLLTGQEKTV
ncbi:MAG: tRNA pseudouridine(38-40) synthase TruA [Anaerolineae bacterium]